MSDENKDDGSHDRGVGRTTLNRVVANVRRGSRRRFVATLMIIAIIGAIGYWSWTVSNTKLREELGDENKKLEAELLRTNAAYDALRGELDEERHRIDQEHNRLKTSIEENAPPPSMLDNMFVKANVARVAVIGVIDIRDKTYYPPLSSGTCFALEQPGYMLTNRHVTKVRKQFVSLRGARGREGQIHVFFAGTKEPYLAEVVLESKRFDMALLYIDKPDWKGLALKESKDVSEGDAVFTCGFPGAGDPFANRDIREHETVSTAFREVDLVHSFTRGIVSAVKDTKRPEEKEAYRQVQTDADINPGNSGGPLLTLDSRVLGIATWKRSDATGISYAVSMDAVNDEVTTAILEHQKARSGE